MVELEYVMLNEGTKEDIGIATNAKHFGAKTQPRRQQQIQFPFFTQMAIFCVSGSVWLIWLVRKAMGKGH